MYSGSRLHPAVGASIFHLESSVCVPGVCDFPVESDKRAMMKFIVLLCFASVGVNAAWLRRQETLSSNDLSENTGTDKADSHAEANSTSGAD